MWHQLSHVMQQGERAVQATVVPGSLDCVIFRVFPTLKFCLKGPGCANPSASMQHEPSPIWHTASKRAVSYFEAVILFNTCFISFWLEHGAHRCGKRPPLSATGAQPCPGGAVVICDGGTEHASEGEIWLLPWTHLLAWLKKTGAWPPHIRELTAQRDMWLGKLEQVCAWQADPKEASGRLWDNDGSVLPGCSFLLPPKPTRLRTCQSPYYHNTRENCRQQLAGLGSKADGLLGK